MEDSNPSLEEKFHSIKTNLLNQTHSSLTNLLFLSFYDILEIYAFLARLGGPPMTSIRKVLRSGGTPLLKLKMMISFSPN